MSLHVHRSTKVEALVDALQASLASSWPSDPFAAVPVLVGSRGMGRWLRHELATRAGSVARLDFLFPRNAFEAAAAWLLAGAQGDEPAEVVFWDVEGGDDAWSGPRLVGRVLRALRSHVEEDAFHVVRRYLRHGSGGKSSSVSDAAPVGAREVAFAAEVARVVEKLHYDRPDDALAWSATPDAAAEPHRWLAYVLRALDAEVTAQLDETPAVGPSPAARLRDLRRLEPHPIARAVHVFGLSSLRPGDKLRLAELAKHLEVHFYVLVPSSTWWGELKDRRAVVKVVREKLAKESLSSLDRAEIAALFSQNELLAANGSPSRDVQLWLEDTEYREGDATSFRSDESDGAATLLASLQRWVDSAEPREEEPWAGHVGCSSVEVHACHGALRQCEALRDELLRRFAADPTLEPRHVLVTTPDVATYAPLVAAVLGRHSPEAPAIPVHVADLGLRATNTVADALLRALALADERVTASLLLELLELWPVRKRFGLDETDLGDVREMVIAAGVRWAWDKDDREAHGQPSIEQNTVRFGLERMALGVLMPDDEPLGFLAGSDDVAPIAPYDVATRDRAARFGRFAAFCAALEEQRRLLRAPGTAASWRERLLRALDELTLVDDESSWLRAQVNDAIFERLPDGLGEELSLDPSGVVSLLADAFEMPSAGDRPVTGAVTVCAMEPMRSVPFRVIAMVGLDDGAFPRAARVAAWDPFASPRLGEHDRRTLDRHLFLEMLLCARDALLLFGTGFEPKRGTKAPLAVVATELADLVVAATGLSPTMAQELSWPVRPHPLQPWSADAFSVPPLARDHGAEPRDRLPYDPVWFRGRVALDRAESGRPSLAGLAATERNARLPEEANPPTTLSARALARALVNAPAELLKGRLGLLFERKDDEVPDREPIELESMELWRVRDRVYAERKRLRALAEEGAHGVASSATSGRAVARVRDRLRAVGELPLESGGDALLREAEERAAAVEGRLAALGVPRGEPLVVGVVIDGVSLSAAVADVRALSDASDAEGREALAFVWSTTSKSPSEAAVLEAWVSLLIAVAAGSPVVAAHAVGAGSVESLGFDGERAAAHERLAELIRVWRLARRQVVPLLPEISRALVTTRRASPELDLAGLLDRCVTAWEGTDHKRGAKADPYVRGWYGDGDVLDLIELAPDVLEFAERVWGTLGVLPKAGKRGANGAAAATTTEGDAT